MTSSNNQFLNPEGCPQERLCMVSAIKWQPADGESIEAGLCRTFGINAADIISDAEEGMVAHRRYNDSRFCVDSERVNYVFFTAASIGRTMVAENPAHMRGPLPPILALAG